MPDYRNRPPVDAPRPTVRSVLTSAPVAIAIVGALGWVALAVLLGALAVLLGWHW